MKDRLSPKNKGNARLLFINHGNFECDICDEKGTVAIIEPAGGLKYVNLDICKKCLKEIIKRFNEK